MIRWNRFASVALLFVGLTGSLEGQNADAPGPVRFRITLGRELGDRAESGRLIVLFTSRSDMADVIRPILADRSVWMAAKEVRNWKPGAVIAFDGEELAFPEPFSRAPAGDYSVMAVLDVNHRYAYSGPYRGLNPGDLRSRVMPLNGINPSHAKPVALTLSERTPEAAIALPAGDELIDFVSATMTQFWGRPIHIQGVVRLPSGYSNGTARYPAAYYIGGYGLDMGAISAFINSPPGHTKPATDVITVILDQYCPGGNHNFTDSVNNGPWATALTTELIPYLESKYRLDSNPQRRFLFGYSSGASAALWLQVNYPRFFGGAWPMAPGPVDMRSVFGGVNLHSNPLPNVYRDGAPWARLLALQGRVLGESGGVVSAQDWIYSPRGDDGRPMPLFDRDTGDVDPEVARAWRRYDLADLIRKDADRLRPLLDNRIHLTIGTNDVSIESARLLEQTLKDARIRADFVYLEGRNHNDVGNDGANPAPGSLLNRVYREMERATAAK